VIYIAAFEGSGSTLCWSQMLLVSDGLAILETIYFSHTYKTHL
jgi:hypothetical protein